MNKFHYYGKLVSFQTFFHGKNRFPRCQSSHNVATSYNYYIVYNNYNSCNYKTCLNQVFCSLVFYIKKKNLGIAQVNFDGTAICQKWV